jgi:predicted permease
MQAVLNAALPIFALILTGFLCGRWRVFSRSAADGLNRFAVYLALPALIFLAMSKITPAQISQIGFALAFGGAMAVTFGLGFWLSRWRGRSVGNASIEGLATVSILVAWLG